MEDVDRSEPRPGQIVEILKGRDAGQYAVVVGIDQKFVLLADGYKRKFDRPKKKNRRHVRLKSFISEHVAKSLHEEGRVTNAKLRNAIQQFHSIRPGTEEKGE